MIHDQVVFLSLTTEDIPHVPGSARLQLDELGNGFYRIVLHYGFMEVPDVPRDISLAAAHGLKLDMATVSYFLGSERIIATQKPGMALWREKLFVVMSRNATSAANFFGLPPDRIVELGTQVEM